MSQPVAVLGPIRNMLKPGGTLIVADERTETFHGTRHRDGRLFYAYSVLCCLPSAMDDDASAATGTVMRP